MSVDVVSYLTNATEAQIYHCCKTFVEQSLKDIQHHIVYSDIKHGEMIKGIIAMFSGYTPYMYMWGLTDMDLGKEYRAWLNPDIVWDPEYLENAYTKAKNLDAPIIVSMGLKIILSYSKGISYARLGLCSALKFPDGLIRTNIDLLEKLHPGQLLIKGDLGIPMDITASNSHNIDNVGFIAKLISKSMYYVGMTGVCVAPDFYESVEYANNAYCDLMNWK
jgi:hypothetical protein